MNPHEYQASARATRIVRKVHWIQLQAQSRIARRRREPLHCAERAEERGADPHTHHPDAWGRMKPLQRLLRKRQPQVSAQDRIVREPLRLRANKYSQG